MSVQFLLQQCLIGLTNGALIALVALGYTMVYGIIGLINFAHGDLIMLGACLALSLVGALGMTAAGPATTWVGIGGLVLICGLFCGLLNVAVDRIVYKPLRNAPKLALWLLQGVHMQCINAIRSVESIETVNKIK